MRVAIMQPYIFPYIGYFQLIHAVDKFIFYDDVHFIKKGWINKNNLLVNGEAKSFTVPLQKVSQNKLIHEIRVNADPKWLKQTLDTIYFNYKNAPFFEPVFELIRTNLALVNEQPAISAMAEMSVLQVMEYLGIKKEFERSSECYSETRGYEKADRLKRICILNNSGDYVNAAGGALLYSKEDFMAAGVRLHFIHPVEIMYRQFDEKFVPWLSIIDVLMFNTIEEVKNILEQYKLV